MTIPIEDRLGENQPVLGGRADPADADATFSRLAGEGAGDYGTAPLADAFEGGGFLEDLFANIRAGLGERADYYQSTQFPIDLIMSDYLNGAIDSKTAPAGLMSDFDLDYDEAEDIFATWPPRGEGVTAPGEAVEDPYAELYEGIYDYLSGPDGPGGGRGGRTSGRAAAVYSGPDSGLVEDFVRGKLVNLVGFADSDRVKLLTDTYFSADRKAFGGESIDPKQSVLEQIRGFDDYQRIHELRTDLEDEDTWITGQHSALLAAGMTGEQAQELAVDFAQAGVASVRAGELSEARRIGTTPTQALPGFFSKVRGALGVAARSVR